MCVCTFIDTCLLLSEEITVTVGVYFLHYNEKMGFCFFFFLPPSTKISGLERKFNCCTLIDNIQIFLIFIL